MSITKDEFSDLESYIRHLEESRVAHYIAEKAYEKAQRDLQYYLIKLKGTS